MNILKTYRKVLLVAGLCLLVGSVVVARADFFGPVGSVSPSISSVWTDFQYTSFMGNIDSEYTLWVDDTCESLLNGVNWTRAAVGYQWAGDGTPLTDMFPDLNPVPGKFYLVDQGYGGDDYYTDCFQFSE